MKEGKYFKNLLKFVRPQKIHLVITCYPSVFHDLIQWIDTGTWKSYASNERGKSNYSVTYGEY